MNVADFLARIGYEGEPSPDKETLVALQNRFLQAVPFENLDIHRQEPILLDVPRIYDKIVTRRRGGFCYECNSVLAAMLEQIGFTVQLASARMMSEGGLSPEFDHLILLVSLDKVYLVDVGNGRSVRDPLPLDGSGEAMAEGRRYKVGAYEPDGTIERYALWYQEGEAAWQPQFVFTTQPRALSEFGGMCHYHQTSLESTFLKKRVATMATENGRVTLLNETLTIVEGESQTERIVAEVERAEVLADYFGIVL